MLGVQIYFAPVDSPMPLPEPPPPVGFPTISYAEVRISAVEVSDKPDPNLAMVGHILINNPAGLGDVTGVSFVVTTGFKVVADNSAEFTMLGVHAAGHHTTVAPEAKGMLILR